MTPQPSEPRTAAGRALLSKRNRGRQMYVSAKRILAIEAEAAAPDPVASPPAEALLLIERLADELAPEPGQHPCGEYPELCTACLLIDEARRFLSEHSATAGEEAP